MAKYVILFIMIIHGLIHLLGFVKAFDIAPVEQLTVSISKPVGIVWLLTTFLFLTTASLFALKNDYWMLAGTASVIISQVLIISSWGDAKFGTIANLILIVSIIRTFLGQLPTS